MAEVKLEYPFDEIRGKVHADDSVYFRKQYGKMRAVKLKNPRTEFSEHEKEVRKGFGNMAHQASEISKDPLLAAPYMDGFNAQKSQEGGTSSLYRYILRQLLNGQR